MPNKKTLIGEIISDKMQKTVVVRVAVQKRHRKYHKRYTVFKKYKAHQEGAEYHVGDLVEIEATRARSREKHWQVTHKLK